MRTCKVIPEQSACSACLETQQMFEMVEDCNKCELRNRIYDVIEVGSNFWGGYVIVSYDGKLEKISLGRIFDIKNKEEQNE